MARTAFLPPVLALLLLAGCDTLPSKPDVAADVPPEVVAPVAAGPAANDNLNAVAWVQTAVEYRLIAGQTWRAALVQLDKAIKSPGWDALPKEDRITPVAGLPLAIIVDIDETMLDNSPYQARVVRDRSSYNEAAWGAWVREEAARPIPGAVEFARAAAARGVTIFYVSNRAADLTEPTLSNLRKAGFPIADARQIMPSGMPVEGCQTKGSDKGCRRQLVGRTHRVLMQVGDQLGDLVSSPVSTPAGREQAVRPYLGWIGERWFVLPNPTYGHWESALFAPGATGEAERRQNKLDALRY